MGSGLMPDLLISWCMHFRLLTYNIHKGIGGVDRRYDLARIVGVIRHHRPDVALLQEVDEGVPRSRRDRQAELIAEAVELPHLAFQCNVKCREGHYGNAILSRFPLSDAVDVDLSIPLKKRRRAQVVRCTALHAGHQRSFTVINVHLGLAGFERRIQIRRLLRHECLAQLRTEAPVILAGDFNDGWGLLRKSELEPHGFRQASGKVRTFPAVAPLRQLDRVFIRGALQDHGAHGGRTHQCRRASDHLPLIVELELTGEETDS